MLPEVNRHFRRYVESKEGKYKFMYFDFITSTLAKKRGLKALIRRCKAGEVDVVLTPCLNHICVNTAQLRTVLETFKENNVVAIGELYGEDTSDPEFAFKGSFMD